MTAAIGGAVTSGMDMLPQSANVKASGNARRGPAKAPDDAESQSSVDTPAPESKARPKGDRNDVDKAKIEKTSSKPDGREQSDDKETSFEDTFESMGQSAPTDASQTQSQPQALPVALTNSQVAVDAKSANVPSADVPTANASASLPTTTLKQASILALMNTRDRLFANAGDTAIDDAVPEQPQIDAGGVADRISATVDRQETHWNFNNTAVASAGLQASSLQLGNHSGAQLASILGVPAASAPADRNESSAVDTDAGSPSSPQISTSESDPLSAFAFGTNAGSSEGETPNQSGSQLQSRGILEAAERKTGKEDVATPLDQIFSTVTSSTKSSVGPTEQVRDGVISTLNDASLSTQQATLSGRPAPTPVLRTLELTLSPADLGSVKLNMSLKSNTLSIEAEASKASTAKLLTDDRGNLERGLRDAGYDVSSVKITDASAASSANANGWQSNNSPSRDPEQSRSGPFSQQNGDAQRRDGGGSSEQSQRRFRESNPQPIQTDAAVRRQGNEIYI